MLNKILWAISAADQDMVQDTDHGRNNLICESSLSAVVIVRLIIHCVLLSFTKSVLKQCSSCVHNWLDLLPFPLNNERPDGAERGPEKRQTHTIDRILVSSDHHKVDMCTFPSDYNTH